MKSLRFYHGAALCLSLLWAPAVSATESASAQSQWTMAGDGGITWEVKPGNTHQDQIEMSGRKVSAIISYGVRENGSLTVVRQIVFPTLRTVFANRGTREVTFSEENGGEAFSVLYNAYIDDSADRNRERLVICGAIIGGKAVWNGKTKLCNLESQRMR